MRNFPIVGLSAHPQREILAEYSGENVPPGPWTGRLDYLARGQWQNLLCYFTDTETGNRYRMSTFASTHYSPSKGGPQFDKEKPGTGRTYIITTEPSKTGLAKFLTAASIEASKTGTLLSPTGFSR